jgi:hypothetical protein
MFKKDLTYTFFKSPSNTWKVTRNLETESEYDLFIQEWLQAGFELISEEPVKQLIEIYPQVLKLNLKGERGGYYSTIQLFKTSQEYTRYCDERLMEGLKVIGSKPYKNFNEQ